MDLSILNTAENPIPTHAYAAFLAVILGGIQLSRPKGTSSHKYLGYTWVSANVVGQHQQLLDPDNQGHWPLQSHPLPIHLYHMVCF